MDLSVLQPFYKGFLEKKGVQSADLFLEWGKTGHRPWVLSAKNITFQGGWLESARLCLGWHDSQVRVQHITLDNLTIDLAKLSSKNENSVSLIPGLLNLLMETSGSIHNLHCVGRDALGKTEKILLGMTTRLGDNAPCPSNNTYSGLFLPVMDIHWAKGKVDVWHSLSQTSEKIIPKDHMGTVLEPQSYETGGTSHARPNQPCARAELKMLPEGIHFTASWKPMDVNIPFWGLHHIRLQGRAKGQWSMKKDQATNWSFSMVVDQVGSAKIIEPCTERPISLPSTPAVASSRGIPPALKLEQQNSYCTLEKIHLSAELSHDLRASVQFQGLLDQAQISVILDTDKASQMQSHPWVANIKVNKGSILISKLRHLWPNIAKTKDARDWILSNFHGGQAHSVSTRIQGEIDKITQKITLKTIQGSFQTRGLAISFMPSLPKIEHMDVASTFNDNGFSITVNKGLFEKHTVHGAVTIQWNKNPTLLTFNALLAGPISHLVPVLLSFADNTGLSFSHLTGSNKTKIFGQLPLISKLKSKDIILDLHCDIPNAGFDLPIENRIAKIRNTPITIDYKDHQLHILGKGPINDILTTWSWHKDTFSFSGKPSVQQIQDILHWSPAPYVKNSPTISGQYRYSTLSIQADLTACMCTIPALNWHKASGSNLTLKWIKKNAFSELLATGSGVAGTMRAHHKGNHPKITAEIRIGKTFGKYLYTGNQSVSSATDLWNTATQSGHHQIFFRSPFLEIPKLFSENDTVHLKTPANPTHQNQKKSVKIDIDWACEKVQMDTITMSHVELWLSGTANAIWPISMDFFNQYSWHEGSFYSENKNTKNKVEQIGHISALWEPSRKKTTRIIADIVDIGSVCNAMGLTQRILGGNVRLNAHQNASGIYTGSIYGDMIKTKTNMLEKLLWTISPTIFTEMFSSGITFSRLDADFRYQPGLLKIIDGIGTGVNLGLSLKGSIYTKPGRFKLQGVAIPSYLINTFFSKFPFLGWILGGKKGLISSEFKVTGPLNDPKFTVLPLSLFKFGFLKNLPFFKKKKKKSQNRVPIQSPMVESPSSIGQKI